MERTACHPFLVQLIASRLFESRDLAATLDQVAADEMVSNFFSVDFQTLDADERSILEEVSREGSRSSRGASRGRWARPRRRSSRWSTASSKMGYLAAEGGRVPGGQLVLRPLAAAGGRGAAGLRA